mmetsp:Transcript_27688/g.44964  ORF Transcript_27688/g.44964 Transcript_27688/m.44964 type:complete len:116 (-) Transcript_27688:76-423(-)
MIPPTKPIVAAAIKLGIPRPIIIARRLRGRESTTFIAEGADLLDQECLTRYWRLGRVEISPKMCINGPNKLLEVHIPLPLSFAAATIVRVWTTLFRAMVATSSNTPAPVVLREDP